ncbi:hypothetical protein GJU43_17545 [Flavobacterium sp. LC2016-23]|uniref:hypothetical protein n=1 Tax=Flavobacterium sp. LC2016-23 TaxID=2666330 RepID=UPI0012B0F819|nr:hypothetical protein [Flavobacterium sp. LC2016-23]MRX41093.1 hypothetical protein [Flavobacterium sp. LC2016-23]
MKYLIIKCLIISLISCNIQSQEKKIIFDFLASCKDENIEITSIKEKYICENKSNTAKKEDSDKFIEYSISLVRKEMQSKDLSKLKILHVANEAQEVKKEFINEDFSKVFVLKDGEKIIEYFLIENGKINAFTTMKKGSIKVFIILCN